MQARDVMTTWTATVGPCTSVADVAAKLARFSVTCVPVIDDDGNLLGIVSEADVLGIGRRDAVRARLARDIMVREVVTAGPGTDICEFLGAMRLNHLKSMPVVAGSKLVGVVSRSDLVKALGVPA